MTAQVNRLAARGFTETNLSQLAADVIVWRKRAALPSGSKVHELASLCIAFASAGDEYQEAERLIVQFALEKSADKPSPESEQQVGMVASSQAAIDDEAYRRLLPKLLELSEMIDEMSEDEYGNWVNALPKDEFFEFIGVSHDEESFRSAVAAAKQLLTKSRAVVSAAR